MSNNTNEFYFPWSCSSNIGDTHHNRLYMNPIQVYTAYNLYTVTAQSEGPTNTLTNCICIPCFYITACLTVLMPKDPYRGRTAPLTSKRCILYIYSTNIGTKYFKHGIDSPFFSLQNAVCFIILAYLVPVLFTFYIKDVLKFKKIIPAPKG